MVRIAALFGGLVLLAGAGQEAGEVDRLLQLPPEHALKWYPPEGLLQASKLNGFVRSEEYCRRTAPALIPHLGHPSPKVRLAVAERLAELRSPAGFDVLLDALEREPNPAKRGDDQWIFLRPGISERAIALVGRPDTYDPHGTKGLRDTVIRRWRERWKAEGDSFFRGLAKTDPLAGRQTLLLDGSKVTKDMTDMSEFYFLSGPKLYAIGAMDGTFPPLGWLLGDGSGLWAHPIKILDGFEFTVREEGRPDWKLIDSRDFSHDFATATFRHVRDGLSIVRTDWIDADEPAAFSTLTLRNETDASRAIELEYSARVNIRPAWRTRLGNDVDILEDKEGVVVATDAGKADRWAVAVGAAPAPSGHAVKDNSAVFTHSIPLAAGRTTAVTFLIVAEHEAGPAAALAKVKTLLPQAEALRARKAAAARDQVYGGVRFQCGDEAIDRAFACAKANLVLLTADLRPNFPGRYFFTGIPEYLNLYGSDNMYSVAGAAAAGFGAAAQEALACLAHFARQQSGRVLHEAVTSGQILSPGNIQETPQFVMSCRRVFQWTGDVEFLRSVFPTCEQCVEYVLKNNDRDGDRYPEGYGLMEVAGMNQENLDAACYLCAALDALAGMAEQLQDSGKAGEVRRQADDLRSRFNRDWWNESARMWADAMRADGAQEMRGQWGVAFPMETRIAEPDKANAALDTIGKRWVNKWDLSEQPGAGFNTCPWSNNILALGAYAYGRSDLGWDRLKLTARVPLEFGMLGAFANTVPHRDDILLVESSGGFLQAVIEGLCGVEPAAGAHRVAVFPQPPQELASFRLQDLKIGEHAIDVAWERGPTVAISHRSGPCPLDIAVRMKRADVERIVLDGKLSSPREDVIRGIPVREVAFRLDPGRSAVVSRE